MITLQAKGLKATSVAVFFAVLLSTTAVYAQKADVTVRDLNDKAVASDTLSSIILDGADGIEQHANSVDAQNGELVACLQEASNRISETERRIGATACRVANSTGLAKHLNGGGEELDKAAARLSNLEKQIKSKIAGFNKKGILHEKAVKQHKQKRGKVLNELAKIRNALPTDKSVPLSLEIKERLSSLSEAYDIAQSNYEDALFTAAAHKYNGDKLAAYADDLAVGAHVFRDGARGVRKIARQHESFSKRNLTMAGQSNNGLSDDDTKILEQMFESMAKFGNVDEPKLNEIDPKGSAKKAGVFTSYGDSTDKREWLDKVLGETNEAANQAEINDEK